MMDEEKRKRLAAAGYVSISVAEFLGLTPEQNELVEIKVALSMAVRQQRTQSSLSQSSLPELLGSSQSRIAKMERGDASVSLDLLIRALVAQGMTRGELAEVIAGKQSQSPHAGNETAPSGSNGAGRRRAPKTPSPRPQAVKV